MESRTKETLLGIFVLLLYGTAIVIAVTPNNETALNATQTNNTNVIKNATAHTSPIFICRSFYATDLIGKECCIGCLTQNSSYFLYRYNETNSSCRCYK